MREWLSGGASPCQGEGRGFDPRLALFLFGSGSLDFQGLPFFVCLKQISHKKQCTTIDFCGNSYLGNSARAAIFFHKISFIKYVFHRLLPFLTHLPAK